MLSFIAEMLLAGPDRHVRPFSIVRPQTCVWKNVQIVAGGFVDGITYHPTAKDVLYCRTDIGGAYRWDPAQHRWIPLLDWLTKPDWNLYGIESLALDPKAPGRLYLACGTYTNSWGGNGAILRSSDQGRTFQRADLPFKMGGNEDGRSMGDRLAVDPVDGRFLLFGTRNTGLWQSQDRGQTWSQSPSFPLQGLTPGIGLTGVAFDPTAKPYRGRGGAAYVGTSSRTQNLWVSSDAGATWTPVPGAPKGMFVHHLAFTGDGDLVETLSNSPGPNGISDGAVYRYRPTTGQWTDITPVKPNSGNEKGFGYAGLSVDPRDGKHLVVSTLDRWAPGDDLFVTHDGGTQWTAERPSAVMDPAAAPYMTWNAPKPRFGWWTGAVALDPFRPDRLLFGTGANIWGCDNVKPAEMGKPTAWTVRGVGIEETADIDLLSPPQGPPLITALGDIGGFTHVDLDRPAPGMSIHPMLGNTDSLASSADGALLVRVGRPDSGEKPGGLSHDHGLTWTPFPTLPVRQARSGSVAVTADGRNIVWSPSSGITAYSSDEGTTWIMSHGLPANSQVCADALDPSLVYALTPAGQFRVSKDGGGAFEPSASPPTLPGEHGHIKTSFGERHAVYIPCATGIFRSTDAGNTFEKMAGVDSAESVGFGKSASQGKPPAIFVNGKIEGQFGVFRSDDDGLTWFRLTDPRHEYGTRGVVEGDQRIYGRFYLGTNGRGVLYGDLK